MDAFRFRPGRWMAWHAVAPRTESAKSAAPWHAARESRARSGGCVLRGSDLSEVSGCTPAHGRRTRPQRVFGRHRRLPALSVDRSGAAGRIRRPQDLPAERSTRQSGSHEHGAQPRGAFPPAGPARRRARVQDSGIEEAAGAAGEGAVAGAGAAALTGRAVAAAEARVYRTNRGMDRGSVRLDVSG